MDMKDNNKQLTAESYADQILQEIEAESQSIDLNKCESLDDLIETLDYDPDDEYYNECAASGQYPPFECDEDSDEFDLSHLDY